jgi:hypothetical protein
VGKVPLQRCKTRLRRERTVRNMICIVVRWVHWLIRRYILSSCSRNISLGYRPIVQIKRWQKLSSPAAHHAASSAGGERAWDEKSGGRRAVHAL